MSFKTTLALLVLLAALGGFYYFVEKQAPSTDDLEKQSKLLLPGFEPGDWLRISISHARAPTAAAVVLSRAGPRDPWRLEAPLAGPADQGQADGILSALQYLDRKGPAREVAPAALGLGTPRVRIELSGSAAEKRLAIALGDEDVTGKSSYAQVDGRGEAAIVPGDALARVDRSLDELRDKTLFASARWKVERVRLRGAPGGPALALRGDNDRWTIEGDGDLADRGALDDLLGAADQARVKRFIADAPAAEALEAYGLRPPARAELVLATGTADAGELLDIGNPAPDAPGEVYVRRPGTPGVVTIEARLVDLMLGGDIERWRSKKVLPFARDAVEALDVRKPGAERALARLERRPGQPWRFVEPRTASADVDATDDLVAALKALEIAQVVAKKVSDPANFGLADKTALLVALETPKARLALKLGKGSIRGDGWYVEREGRDAAYEVVFPKAATLRAAWPALRDRSLLALAPSEVARIDVTRAGLALRPYARKPDGWSTPEAQADAASLEKLAEDLAALRAGKIHPTADAASLEALGLKAPWLTATVSFTSEAEPAATLRLGKLVGEGDAYNALFQRGEDVLAVTVAKELVNELDRVHIAPPAPAPGGAPTGNAVPTETPK